VIFIQYKTKAKPAIETSKININEARAVEIAPEYIKKILKFNESNVLQINAKYPVIKIKPSSIYKKAEKKFNGFYQSIAKNFADFCEKELYKSTAFSSAAHEKNLENDDYTGEFKPFGAVVTFETAYNKRDFLCIYIDVNIYSGKGRGNTVRKAHIWKFVKNNIMPISSNQFVKSDKQIKNKICEYICRVMETQVKNGEERYKSGIDSLSTDVYRYLNVKNFYLSEIKNKDETGYSFFFPQNTIAPYDSGIVSFTVPENVVKIKNS